jgi:hypothetical protein
VGKTGDYIFMEKNTIFNFAKESIDSDICMYHKTKNGEYIFFNSKRHYAGSCYDSDILEWLKGRR